MKFESATNSQVNGTCLQGYVETTYAKLVEVFGEPQGASDKTTAEWFVQFGDGTIATIYDWKVHESPMDKYSWHIGGFNKQAVYLVQKALEVTAIIA